MRVIEADMNPETCQDAHIPGAVFWNIFKDLMKPDLSLNLDSKAISELLSDRVFHLRLPSESSSKYALRTKKQALSNQGMII